LAGVLGVGEGHLLHRKALRVKSADFAKSGSLFQSFPKLRFSPQDPTQTYALRIFALPGGTKTPIFQPEQLAEGCIRLPLPISEIQGVNPWVF
ncbi:hypothetical protein, partial [Pseudomonas aeruginosa]|uniref:hypothetical protein n=1 Tax=Pseudomonas aeruginosa TaxID=287 RepID=UPI001F2A801C